jgi:putative hydrolase of the HAD superfamily
MEIRCILFDLGGVLVELLEEKALMQMCPHLEDRNQVHDAWVASPAVRAFETGKIGFDQFCESAMADLGIKTTVEAFREAHTTFLGNPFPGAEDLVRAVKERHTVACLSNTNVEHVRGLRERSDLLDVFDHLFLSFETGLVKPDADAFLHVAESVQLLPGEILFIDDKWQNVEAAQLAGLQGFVATSIGEARDGLLNRGLLHTEG